LETGLAGRIRVTPRPEPRAREMMFDGSFRQVVRPRQQSQERHVQYVMGRPRYNCAIRNRHATAGGVALE
jgi:predicted ATP-dependent serine protease